MTTPASYHDLPLPLRLTATLDPASGQRYLTLPTEDVVLVLFPTKAAAELAPLARKALNLAPGAGDATWGQHTWAVAHTGCATGSGCRDCAWCSHGGLLPGDWTLTWTDRGATSHQPDGAFPAIAFEAVR